MVRTARCLFPPQNSNIFFCFSPTLIRPGIGAGAARAAKEEDKQAGSRGKGVVAGAASTAAAATTVSLEEQMAELQEAEKRKQAAKTGRASRCSAEKNTADYAHDGGAAFFFFPRPVFKRDVSRRSWCRRPQGLKTGLQEGCWQDVSPLCCGFCEESEC